LSRLGAGWAESPGPSASSRQGDSAHRWRRGGSCGRQPAGPCSLSPARRPWTPYSMNPSHPVNEESLRELVIPSRTEEGQRVETEILEALATHQWDEKTVFGVRLALEEALVNAIKHGNRLDPAKHVTVRYTIDAERIFIEIEDEGPGFSPSDVPDPTLPENLEQPSGRGLMLMRAYMDQIEYRGPGNCVRMFKAR